MLLPIGLLASVAGRLFRAGFPTLDADLRQVLQNRLGAGPFAGTPTDLAPCDAPVCFDDERSRRGKPIAQQIVNTVGLAHLVVGVGQHGEGKPSALAPSFH
jgi:hypothetical protein